MHKNIRYILAAALLACAVFLCAQPLRADMLRPSASAHSGIAGAMHAEMDAREETLTNPDIIECEDLSKYLGDISQSFYLSLKEMQIPESTARIIVQRFDDVFVTLFNKAYQQERITFQSLIKGNVKKAAQKKFLEEISVKARAILWERNIKYDQLEWDPRIVAAGNELLEIKKQKSYQLLAHGDSRRLVQVGEADMPEFIAQYKTLRYLLDRKTLKTDLAKIELAEIMAKMESKARKSPDLFIVWAYINGYTTLVPAKRTDKYVFVDCQKIDSNQAHGLKRVRVDGAEFIPLDSKIFQELRKQLFGGTEEAGGEGILSRHTKINAKDLLSYFAKTHPGLDAENVKFILPKDTMIDPQDYDADVLEEKLFHELIGCIINNYHPGAYGRKQRIEELQKNLEELKDFIEEKVKGRTLEFV